MTAVTFVTGNDLKYRNAAQACSQAGIEIVQQNLEIDEIQGEDAERIARRKCQDAYDLVQSDVLINDDSWSVPALGGFPGPYMKSMNHWLTADDWLRLTATLADKSVILTQYTIFQNSDGQRVFKNQIPGRLVDIPRGHAQQHPFQEVVSLDGDDGKSIAEVLEADPYHFAQRESSKIWHDFAQWYNTSIGLGT